MLTFDTLFCTLRHEKGDSSDMKCNFFLAILTTITVLTLTACYRSDIRTEAYSVPQLRSTECLQIMQKALAQVDGVVSVEPNMANQTLSVTYDSKKLNVKNIEYALVREGFDVNDNKGNEQARQKLPADCR